MYIGKHYKFSEFLAWTKQDVYVLTILAIIPTILFQVFDLKWIAIPWGLVALAGTAVAVIVGFKNTQTYNRLWEARQVWSYISKTSRTWALMSRDFVHADKKDIEQLVRRHCAWLTSLRFQLRKPQPWEKKINALVYKKVYTVPEWEGKLEEELKEHLSEEERIYVLGKKNVATQLIALQSKHLRSLRSEGKIEPYEYVELERRLSDFYEHQSKCETIKKFPYPRQFASINLFMTWVFVVMLPFGMLHEFHNLGENLSGLPYRFR